MQAADKVASPCIDVCALDDDGYCLGCLRTMGEISSWPHLDAPGRRQVLARLERRRAGRDDMHPDDAPAAVAGAAGRPAQEDR